jgi:hypothetical protein
MRFIKKLVFRFIKDDIENVLKAHDKAIMDHYHQIIEDVEEILKHRNEEINDILKAKLDSLDSKFETANTDLHSEMKRLVANESISARDVANEIDTDELVEDLIPRIDYSIMMLKAMDILTKWSKERTI